MIEFTKETCGNLDAALRREWLETNGLGGFASSTITGSEHPPLSWPAGRGHQAAGGPGSAAVEAGRDVVD